MKNIIPFLLFPFTLSSCSAQHGKVQLDPQPFFDSIRGNSKAVLLDVRTPGEYSKGFIGNAVNMDINDEAFSGRIANLDKNTHYYVYCLAGGRSTSAINQMKANGITNLTELKGGMMAWRKAGLPVVEMESVEDKISREDYDHLIAGPLVLIDFYAPWCGPCRKMEPHLGELQKKYEGKVKLVRINIDENKNLATQLGVMEIPVLKFYKDGKEVWDHRGYAAKNVIEKEISFQLKQ